MLRRLRLVDFKSFADEAIDVAPLTLLVGANASGKSNCLDALRFLHETIVDESIVEILDGEQRPGAGPNAWQGLRGGSKETSRIGAESFLIESTWEISESPEADIVRPTSAMHRIRCRTVPRPTRTAVLNHRLRLPAMLDAPLCWSELAVQPIEG
jgi:AAA ATPase-like protein